MILEIIQHENDEPRDPGEREGVCPETSGLELSCPGADVQLFGRAAGLVLAAEGGEEEGGGVRGSGGQRDHVRVGREEGFVEDSRGKEAESSSGSETCHGRRQSAGDCGGEERRGRKRNS